MYLLFILSVNPLSPEYFNFSSKFNVVVSLASFTKSIELIINWSLLPLELYSSCDGEDPLVLK